MVTIAEFSVPTASLTGGDAEGLSESIGCASGS